MISRIAGIVYNVVRLLGKQSYSKLLMVHPSTKVDVSKKGRLQVGNKFRTRRNVEINVRDNANIIIGDNVFLNTGCILTARNKIIIGNGTIFGPNVVVYDNDHSIENGKVKDNEYVAESVHIGNNVWIGANVTILKGCCIEDNAVIAAGSIVKGVVEEGMIMVQKRKTTKTPLVRGGV